jgi:3-hydroxybutyryl-CoA dehydrogenase
MRICILASEDSRNEILQKKTAANVEIEWMKDLDSLIAAHAHVYMDLLFRNTTDRIKALETVLPATVFINSVTDTAVDSGGSFIRINAWPGFLQTPVTEIAAANEVHKEQVKKVMETLGWAYKIVPDLPGMIAPRVVAMIINEAYFALEEQVSTKAEIDIAMKLGTNYPLGPFEWAKKIGLDNIKELLDRLSKTDERYLPSEALKNDKI